MSVRSGVALLAALYACGDDTSADTSPDVADASFDGSEDAAREAGDAGADAGTGLVGPEIAYATEEACFEWRGESGLVRFTWGDESTSEGVGVVCHTWEYPGAFLVIARNAAGVQVDRVVHVVLRPADPRPTRSSPILYDEARDLVWVVTPDDDSVAVIDARTLERRALLPACGTPRTLASDGVTIAVACQEDAVALFDADDFSREVLPLAGRPFGICATPAGDAFLVTLQDRGELVTLREGAVADTLEVGPDVRAISVGAQGVVLVTRWRASSAGATIYAVDLETRTVREVLLPRQERLDSDTDNSGVPSFLDTVVFTPDGIRALVPSLKANVVTGEFRTGAPLRDETTARAVLSEVVAFESASESPDVEQSFRFSFDDLDYASALVATHEGERVYVAFLGAQRVVALDAFSFDVGGSIADVGHAPRGLALNADDTRLFVWAELSREVRVYDVTDLRREPAALAMISTLDDEPLDPEVLRGKQVFAASLDPRMSRTSYLSCASCHLDGEGDNLVWDFTQRGEGLRNTPSLRGSEEGMLHWTGNFDEVQDFENDIRLHQSGEGFLSDEDFERTRDTLGVAKAGLSAELDALAAYVESLRGPVGPSSFPPSAAGAQVFEDAGCATCHTGAATTDSATGARHDVGTLGDGSGGRRGGPLDGLDTPSLHGLWRSAPYLHDGSAETLEELWITRNAGDLHGITSGLSADDISALAAHLRSLP